MSMIDGIDDRDPRLQRIITTLQYVLAPALERDLEPATLVKLGEAVAWYRAHVLDKYGGNFPHLTAVVLPSIRFVALGRADWTRMDIDAFVSVLKTRHPLATPHDFAWGFKRAWPDYVPKDRRLFWLRELMEQV